MAFLIALYVIALSSKTIATYTTGNTLFDLATFEQGFWNATRGTLFHYSLEEGDLSRFGRHFSPIFFLLLPLYALRPDPSTLLALQSLALGLGAVPLYLVARRRLASPLAALVIAALYLANPAVHDVNTVNEFHEIAFATPLLFLAFLAAERRRWPLYALAVVLALLVKEEVALTTAALGLYVALAGRHDPRACRIGLATVAGSVAWFLLVVEVVMPALRGPYGPVPFPGYDYLGEGAFGIARGLLTNTDELWRIFTSEPRRRWIFWLLAPLAFLPLLAPEVLLIAAPATLLVLASTYTPTFAIFERYVAPVVPFAFLAAVVAVDRLRRAVAGSGSARMRRLNGALALGALVGIMAGATFWTQDRLGKYPVRLVYPGEPDPHAAVAITFAEAIPERASVVIEDHRWLAHAAHRRRLYFLSGASPDADYLLLDRKITPVTNAPVEARARAARRIVGDPNYRHLRCEDGVSLYARRDAEERDGSLFPPYRPAHPRDDLIGDRLRLRGYDLTQGDGTLDLVLYWEALRAPLGGDYVASVRLLDAAGNTVVVGPDGTVGGACGTTWWQAGQVVRDPRPLTHTVPAPLPAGEYTLRIAPRAPDGAPLGDEITIPLTLGR